MRFDAHREKEFRLRGKCQKKRASPRGVMMRASSALWLDFSQMHNSGFPAIFLIFTRIYG